jgi:hypothetical protein
MSRKNQPVVQGTSNLRFGGTKKPPGGRRAARVAKMNRFSGVSAVRRYVSRPDKIADRYAHVVWSVETLLIQVDDMELDGDELQPVFVRHHYADGLSAKFDNLLLHGTDSRCGCQAALTNEFSGTIEPERYIRQHGREQSSVHFTKNAPLPRAAATRIILVMSLSPMALRFCLAESPCPTKTDSM